MYLLNESEKLSADLKCAIQSWVDSKIDELCSNHPNLANASVYLKRGLNNWLSRKESQVNDMVDTLALFVADKEGNIDADSLIDDAVAIFRDMEVNYCQMGAFAIEYGKGNVVINIPRNLFFDMIFGDLGKIKLSADDILELKPLLVGN